MKKLSALAQIALLRTRCFLGIAKPVAGTIGEEMAPAALTMDLEDLTTPRAKAAVRIVNEMNSCIHVEQLEVVRRKIELFEQMYDSTLPLRTWWNNAMFNLTYYPKNA